MTAAIHTAANATVTETSTTPGIAIARAIPTEATATPGQFTGRGCIRLTAIPATAMAAVTPTAIPPTVTATRVPTDTAGTGGNEGACWGRAGGPLAGEAPG